MLTIYEAEALSISPVKVRDLPAFIKAVEPIAKALADGDILAALAHHADEVITATAIGAGVPRTELEESTPDVLVLLASRVMEVNADFFVRQVLPLITAGAEKIALISELLWTSGPSASAEQG